MEQVGITIVCLEIPHTIFIHSSADRDKIQRETAAGTLSIETIAPLDNVK